MSLALVLYELILTRVFAIVMFAQFAHLAISLALLGVGVGALALHLFSAILPDDDARFAARIGWLSVAMAISMVLAVWATVNLPLTRLTDDLGDSRVVEYLAREKIMGDLIDTKLLAVIVPLLAAPFACAGAVFAGVFRRVRESIGLVYAADLCGGAVGCVLFLPALALLRGPDAVVACALVAAGAAWIAFRGIRRRAPRLVAATLVGVGLAAVVAGRSSPLLAIRYAAGLDERGVVEDVWTPTARLAVWENAGRAFITLVLFSLLVSSGLGSLFAGRIVAQGVRAGLVIALCSVLALAALHAFVLSPILTRHLLGLPLIARNVVVGLTLVPLGFAMGMSFPLALRSLPAEQARLVPWCWAINGWMSVVASVVTVFLARLEGYAAAFVLALLAYGFAIPLSLWLSPRRMPASTPAELPSTAG